MANKEAKLQRAAGKPRKSAVFIEIGNDWIKLVQVDAGSGGVVLSKVRLEPIDADIAIFETISRALKAGKFSSSAVFACLPRQAVNLRLLELPSTDAAEIADMVELQIGRQTPYSRDEILSDYKPLGLTRQGTYTRIMLAIVQRSIVRERFYEIEQAGLGVEHMGVSSEGVLSWFLHRTRSEPQDKDVAVIDVDSFYSQVLVLHRGEVVFTKSILVGAKQLLESREESSEKFMQEVKRAFESCRGDLRDGEIESITLSGAGVHIEGLANELGTALEMPCEEADCLADVSLGKGAGDLGDSRYATASLTALIGMALDSASMEFNFVPDVVRMRKTLLSTAFSSTALASLFMAAMVSAPMYAMISYSFKASSLAALSAEVERTQPEIVKVERMLEVIRESTDRQDTRFSVVNLLSAIHGSVPEHVYFETVDIGAEGRTVTLAGTAPARSDIRDFLKKLGDSPLFGEVAEDGNVTMDKDGRFKFRAVAQFEEDE